MKRDQTFICDNCLREFPQGDEAVAVAEMMQNFGYLPPAERGVVCDDCYKEIMAATAGQRGRDQN